MTRPPPHMLLLLLLLLAAGVGSTAAQEDDITIYRCTDAKGQLTLQDAPCGKDKSQQTRRMLQPQDPPPGATPATRASATQTTIPEASPAIVLRTPQPMYECVRADGDRYASDDDAGNPRWAFSDWTLDDTVPVYTSGIVAGATATSIGSARNSVSSASAGNGAPRSRLLGVVAPEPSSRPPPRPGHGHGGHGHGPGFNYGYGGGTWVRDECHALPQVETCARLRDRREEIRRRFFNAQETERATLDKEERGVNARLSADCGGA